jgi:hypothetical protein
MTMEGFVNRTKRSVEGNVREERRDERARESGGDEGVSEDERGRGRGREEERAMRGGRA